MTEVYLLNDVCWDTREMYTQVYMDKEECKKAFDEKVQEYMDDHGLEKEDFNRENPVGAYMELDSTSMYDGNEGVEIYFITLDLL